MKTQAGRDVVIYSISAGGEYPIHGAYDGGDNIWFITSWRYDGRRFPEWDSELDLKTNTEFKKMQFLIRNENVVGKE